MAPSKKYKQTQTDDSGASSQLQQRILEYIAGSGYEPKKLRPLARAMGVAQSEYGRFRDAVKALAKSGRIVLGRGNAIMPPAATGKIVGTYRANPRGFGFVVPEDPTVHGDLYVPPGKALDAITGDVVVARVLRRKRKGRALYEGQITEVLERGASQFVGLLQETDGQHFVIPDGNALHTPIFVGDVTAKAAKEGDQVVVEIVTYPAPGRPARGVIVEVLGKRGDPDVDVLSVIRQYHLPDEFSQETLQEARRIVRDFDVEAELPDRLDLRSETIITIDPADARDFDDAISLKRLKDGTWELGVHIADVSRFVIEGGPLDQEAQQRGNSAYFPRFVVPMLPEVLSNGLCSLQEGEPRLTKSVFIQYDAAGRVVGQRFANSVISSTKRLTYEQAQAILDGKSADPAEFPPAVVDLLKNMEHLAKVIRKRRIKEGMLVLEMPEVELVLDDEGRVIDAAPADDAFTHTIIEMFMVEANEAVARLFDQLDVPILRRIHPEPEDPDMLQLRQFLQVLGYKLPADLQRRAIQRLLDSVRGKPQSYAVNLAVLRSMQRAEYSPKNLGHYALASKHYCHFTSPIRRYPDLTVHRLLDRYLRGRLRSKADRAEASSYEQLEGLGRHCSYTERRAEDAERELRTVKVLELLAQRIGETIEGVVTGVTSFGIFVQCRKFLIEGLVRFEELPDDWWEISQRAGAVVGARTGRRFQIGDLVQAKIVNVNVPARQLDLSMAEEETTPATAPARAGRKTVRRKKAGKTSRRPKTVKK